MNDLLALAKPYKRAPVVTNSKQWPQTVKARFIEPGLVDYKDLGLGMILVQRPFLNKVRDSFVGKPVIDAQHKDAKPENFNEIADGVVIRVWTDSTDGWDWCEFLVWDDETLRHTRDPQYFVSCAYDPTKLDKNGGKHHNVPYDGEFLDGSYTHLAIVKDPRYEGAKIVWNSLGAKPMKNLFKLFTAPLASEAEVDGAATFIEVDGEKVSVENAVKLIQAASKKPAPVTNGAMKDDDFLEIDGKKYTGKDIKNAISNAKKAKNAQEKGEKADDQEEEVDEEKEEGKKREKAATNSLASIDALGLPKDEKITVLNALAAKDEHQNDEAQAVFTAALNALGTKDDKKHLEDFRQTAEMRNNQPGVPTLNTMEDRLKAGMESYGKMKQEVA